MEGLISRHLGYSLHNMKVECKPSSRRGRIDEGAHVCSGGQLPGLRITVSKIKEETRDLAKDAEQGEIWALR